MAKNSPARLLIQSLFISFQLRLKPAEVVIGLRLVAKERLVEIPGTKHKFAVCWWVVCLGFDHLVHAIAEAAKACVVLSDEHASRLSWQVLRGADDALPSVVDGGSTLQACVSFGAWEAVGAGVETCIAFVAGPDADSMICRHRGEENESVVFLVWLIQEVACKMEQTRLFDLISCS